MQTLGNRCAIIWRMHAHYLSPSMQCALCDPSYACVYTSEACTHLNLPDIWAPGALGIAIAIALALHFHLFSLPLTHSHLHHMTTYQVNQDSYIWALASPSLTHFGICMPYYENFPVMSVTVQHEILLLGASNTVEWKSLKRPWIAGQDEEVCASC